MKGVKTFPYGCSIECRGKQARGWRGGQGPGPEELRESMMQEAHDWIYLSKRFLWLLGGEEPGGTRQEGISCMEAVAESR